MGKTYLARTFCPPISPGIHAGIDLIIFTASSPDPLLISFITWMSVRIPEVSTTKESISLPPKILSLEMSGAGRLREIYLYISVNPPGKDGSFVKSYIS